MTYFVEKKKTNQWKKKREISPTRKQEIRRAKMRNVGRAMEFMDFILFCIHIFIYGIWHRFGQNSPFVG